VWSLYIFHKMQQMDNKITQWSEVGTESGSIFFTNLHIIVMVDKNLSKELLRNVFFKINVVNTFTKN
jgi:hypothetical protein